MALLEDSLKVVSDLNYRPLILSQTQIAAILAIPSFNEVCFYLTKEERGLLNQERGVFTLRYGVLDASNNLLNFDGMPVRRGFNINNFHNNIEKLEVSHPSRMGSNTGVQISKIAGANYFLNHLYNNLLADTSRPFAGFFITKLSTGNYEVHSAILNADFGGGAGPGSTNTKPGP